MNLDTTIQLIFKNKEGASITTEATFQQILDRNLDDFHEDLEDSECTSSSCNTESQNFCDCPAEYEDYELKEFNVLPSQEDDNPDEINHLG